MKDNNLHDDGSYVNYKLQKEPKKIQNTKIDTKKMVGMAVFSALAFAVALVIRVPVSFLTFDAKDAILAIAAFIYGPISAIIMSLLTALIELVTVSDTAFYGALMNFVSSAVFSGTAALIYKYRRTFNGAIIGIFSAVAATTALMMPMNILITPLYMGVPRSAVVELIPPLLLPFNFAKSLMNGAIALLVYKPVANTLRRARLLDGTPMGMTFNKQSVITIIAGVTSLAAAIVMFVILNK